MSLVYNERIKLFATALSNTGIATIVTSIVAPMAAFLYGSAALSSDRWPLIGQLALGMLKDDKP
jgi:hypothetical protein